MRKVKTYASSYAGTFLVMAMCVSDPAAGQCWNWDNIAPLNSNAATDSGSDEYPRLATDGAGNWVVVWGSFDDMNGTIGTDQDILVARSSDNGQTWADPQPLNNNAWVDTGNDIFPHVSTDQSGNWIATWQSFDTLDETVGTDLDLFVSLSSDNGLTWTDPVPLNNNAQTDVGNDLEPRVSTDGWGNWVATWSSDDSLGDTVGPDFDIFVARSNDDGQTWTAPEPLNNNAYVDSATDVVVQESATDQAGNWVVAWHSDDTQDGTIGADQDILVARSSDNGQTWTDPAPLNNNAAVDSGTDVAPRVITDASGTWVAVWRSDDTLGDTIGTDKDILVASSSDNGQTWTDPSPLNDTALLDSVEDADPVLAADGIGNWVAVWGSFNDLDGTIGSDGDLLVSRSINGGQTWTDAEPLNQNAGVDFGLDRWADIRFATSGEWVTVWTSSDDLGGAIGNDQDILVTRVTPPDWQDCNANDIPDECDIADGTSDDANEDGIPDECQPCELVRRLVVTCDDDPRKVRAVIRSLASAGIEYRLVVDGVFYTDKITANNGVATANWIRPMPGVHEICIDECGICETVECSEFDVP